MKKLKLYTKTFFYTLGLLLFIVFMAHALLYFLTPQVPLELSADTSHAETMLTGSINLTPYIKQMILKVLPISLGCCILVSFCDPFCFRNRSRFLSNIFRQSPNGWRGWTKLRSAKSMRRMKSACWQIISTIYIKIC